MIAGYCNEMRNQLSKSMKNPQRHSSAQLSLAELELELHLSSPDQLKPAQLAYTQRILPGKRLTDVVRTPHGSAGVTGDAAGVSMNSNSSGDSGWIFAVVMAGATNARRKGEGKGGE